MPGFLEGKKALITGLISNRSIAYGIAAALHREGAELAFTYQSEKFSDRVKALAEDFNSDLVFPCDVADDLQIAKTVKHLNQSWNHLDILIHSIAFAPAEQLHGNFLDSINREGFRVAHEISAYSFAALAKAFKPMMLGRKASLLTLTYLGAERVIENYNVMGLAKASLESCLRYLAASLGPEGIRVNGISAGPIKTLAAAGIGDFRKSLDWHNQVAPLGTSVTTEQVGNVAAFLSSDLASGITGEIIFVDGGFHIMGMPPLANLQE